MKFREVIDISTSSKLNGWKEFLESPFITEQELKEGWLESYTIGMAASHAVASLDPQSWQEALSILMSFTAGSALGGFLIIGTAELSYSYADLVHDGDGSFWKGVIKNIKNFFMSIKEKIRFVKIMNTLYSSDPYIQELAKEAINGRNYDIRQSALRKLRPRVYKLIDKDDRKFMEDIAIKLSDRLEKENPELVAQMKNDKRIKK